MTSQEIVMKLLVYQLQLMNILDLTSDPDFVMDISNEYSYITADIHVSGKPFAQVRFEVNDEDGKLDFVHFEDPSAKEKLIHSIKMANWHGWQTHSNVDLPYSHEVLNSLQTADYLASLSKNCAAGDDYRPGNFSKVSVNHERIKLEQINHMNARSLKHKENYSLRNLVCTIPFESTALQKERLDAFHIGKMTVQFSDRSSENNKACGQRVVGELKRLQGK